MSGSGDGQELRRIARALEYRAGIFSEQALPDTRAIRLRRGAFHAVQRNDPISMRDLLHMETQKDALIRNTQKFLQDRPCNDALLWGARGTGKSSVVKALLNHFDNTRLRIIESDKFSLANLPDLAERIYDSDDYFIVFCDDLSFMQGDDAYTALKAALDGSVTRRPDNMLIYATSNRRHLIPEKMRDNLDTQYDEDGEIHPSDTVEEATSLAERFGLWLSFRPLTQAQYLDIVEHWLRRDDVPVDDMPELHKQAARFAIQRGSRSGRVAQQFARDWCDARE